MSTATRSTKMRLLHSMLNEAGLMSHKEHLLEGYGVEHASELSDAQLSDLIARVRQLRDGTNAHVRQLRSQILTILQQMDIYKDNGSWGSVNLFLENPRIAGKRLYQLSEEELEALPKKLYKLRDAYLKNKALEIWKSKMN